MSASSVLFSYLNLNNKTPVPTHLTAEDLFTILNDPTRHFKLSSHVLSVTERTPNDQRIDNSFFKTTADSRAALRESQWYQVVEATSRFFNTTWDACFEPSDRENGVVCYVFAPCGVEMREEWCIVNEEDSNDSHGQRLILEEHIEIRCPKLVAWYVKKSALDGHEEMVRTLFNIAGPQENKLHPTEKN